MMKLLPVLTLATLAPLAAAAEGIALGPDLTLTGDLALQHTDDSWEKITDFTADLRFSWRPATDTALSFGLEGGIESFVALS
ncbi:hypothetical protein [Pseudogemmobacter faecipullorum]|uniref:Uncharacterized protein n=1 Tax=Pseudogemmobacter faecipullorum TaxID=2755041 RepID=A0ABS8CJZ3_9RHOB|nr:hypothetical protein [Pseudogemmobacter faecipullorum]MCB5409717.1 hypothetical protein [Pseudogemmobacter faecipullorum]